MKDKFDIRCPQCDDKISLVHLDTTRSPDKKGIINTWEGECGCNHYITLEVFQPIEE